MRCARLVSTIGAFVILGLVPIYTLAQNRAAGAPKQDNKAASVPTPRTADGHPNLTGDWADPGDNDYHAVAADGSKVLSLYSPTAKSKSEDPDGIQAFLFGDEAAKRRRNAPNQPPYKPELLPKVESLIYKGNFGAGGEPEGKLNDPAFFCKNPGIPRLGAPLHIYQSSNMIVFLYAPLSGNAFREIPIDGRPHDKTNLDTYMGDSVGHWEGDTLVIDSTQFTDETWLAEGGIHSAQMHVVERLSRQGNTLHYQATVEDPQVFTRPWVMNPRILFLKSKANPIVESPACIEREAVHMEGKD
jgi:hypothetical protein